MKLQSIKRGFTLIELLVVITIIGILATGATTVFTSQIQKARDTTRITSVNALKGAVEQVYQDTSEYPQSSWFLSWATINVSTYMETIPKDPKHWENCNNTEWTTMCAFTYRPAADTNGIDFGAYEISTAFENKWNVTAKAKGDSWDDDTKFEIGLTTSIIDSSLDESATGFDDANIGACDVTTDGPLVYTSTETTGPAIALIYITGKGDCSASVNP